MDNYLKIALLLHVASGFTALGTGFSALITKKGGKAHRTAGKIFFYAMIAVAITAVGIAIPKRQTFLLMVAIFAFFQTYFGYRSIHNKKMQAGTLDWSVLLLAAVNAFFMIYSLEVVLIVFGSISAVLAFGQWQIYMRVRRGEELPKTLWLRQHIGMMMGAFIATITAFLLVNARGFEPNWIPWLAPTVVLVPLIAYFQGKYAPNRKQAVI